MASAAFVGRMVALVRRLDPSRPVDSASGGRDLCTPPIPSQSCGRYGNFTDIHGYPQPSAPAAANPRTARVNGEYGGVMLQPSHLEPPHAEWLPGACSGQAKANSSAELAATFVGFSKAIARLRDEKGLSASVYTQLTDVETECNGLLTYDRVWKLDAAGVRAVSAANDALTGGNLGAR